MRRRGRGRTQSRRGGARSGSDVAGVGRVDLSADLRSNAGSLCKGVAAAQSAVCHYLNRAGDGGRMLLTALVARRAAAGDHDAGAQGRHQVYKKKTQTLEVGSAAVDVLS